MPNDSIFVSYSRRDADFVTPVVQLLRGTRELVFRDADSIKPGSKWRQEIEAGLQSSSLFVLFWCAHSAASPQVKGEYELALAHGKDILPVLFDDTPLPDSLGAYQWVDFRELAAVAHPKRRARRLLVGVSALVLTFSLAGSLFLAQRQQLPDTGAETAGDSRPAHPPAPAAPPSPEPEPVESPTADPMPEELPGLGAAKPPAAPGAIAQTRPFVWGLAAIAAVTIGAWMLATMRRRRAHRLLATASQQRMATALQAELLRRGDRLPGHVTTGAR